MYCWFCNILLINNFRKYFNNTNYYSLFLRAKSIFVFLQHSWNVKVKPVPIDCKNWYVYLPADKTNKLIYWFYIGKTQELCQYKFKSTESFLSEYRKNGIFIS